MRRLMLAGLLALAACQKGAPPTAPGAWRQVATVAPAQSVADPDQPGQSLCLHASNMAVAARPSDWVALWWAAAEAPTRGAGGGAAGMPAPREFAATLAWSHHAGAAWSRPGAVGGLSGQWSGRTPPQLIALPDGSLLALPSLRPAQHAEETAVSTVLSTAGAWGPAEAFAPQGLQGAAAALGPDGALSVVGVGPAGPAYLRRAGSGAWGAPEPLAATGGSPIVAVSGDGHVLAAWLDTAASDDSLHGFEVVYRLRDPATGAWSAEKRLGHKVIGVHEPLAAAAGLGFLIAYVDFDGGPPSVIAIGPSGEAGAPMPVGAKGNLPSFLDLRSEAGGVVVSWSDYPVSGQGRSTYAALRGPDGAWKQLPPIPGLAAVFMTAAGPAALVETGPPGQCPALGQFAFSA